MPIIVPHVVERLSQLTHLHSRFPVALLSFSLEQRVVLSTMVARQVHWVLLLTEKYAPSTPYLYDPRFVCSILYLLRFPVTLNRCCIFSGSSLLVNIVRATAALKHMGIFPSKSPAKHEHMTRLFFRELCNKRRIPTHHFIFPPSRLALRPVKVSKID